MQNIDLSRLTEISYALSNEIFIKSNNGKCLRTSPIFCNVKQNHGLLMCEAAAPHWKNLVLLSALDESVTQSGYNFNLATHKYPAAIFPDGLKYIRNCNIESDKYNICYCIGNIALRKTLFFNNINTLQIEYELLEAFAPIELQLNPLLAFREIFELQTANSQKYNIQRIYNGISVQSEGLPTLYMQTDCKNIFIENDKWYYNFEYQRNSHPEHFIHEDLFSPGQILVQLKVGQKIRFTADTVPLKQLSTENKIERKMQKPQETSNRAELKRTFVPSKNKVHTIL